MYTSLVTLSCSYLVGLALYRVFFHPLHKYPGPILAALTDWYEGYYNIVKSGGMVAEIGRLHKLYGPVIRVGPNTLHFNDRRAYHDIYTYGSTLVKDPKIYLSIGAHAPNGLPSLCDPQEAKSRRALLGPLFSRQALIELEHTIQRKVDQLVALLENRHNSLHSSAMMFFAYRSLTTDVITEYCFADSTDTLSHPDFSHPIVISVRDILTRIWIQSHFPFLIKIALNAPQKLILWLLPAFGSYVHMKARYEQQVDELIRNPDALSNADHETIFHHLLQPKDPGLQLSRSLLVQEAFTLVAAGSDTVGNVCTVGTYFALKNRSICQRLSKELCEVWPNKGRPMSFVTLERLPYLTAFIKESLRFAIGVAHPLPRVVGHDTPEIGGLKLPTGTTVGMSQVFMHVNSDVFPDPYTFKPERWLVGETKEMMADLVTFSKGPRICLAWTELYLIFGNIFRKLDLDLTMMLVEKNE
ncbi:hypothetical protein GYMLUDRAFT_150862 [Collybiopsis luxurians FD-317 M1]|nr:hypothetical protein GYMLUDRAFT_150862 [Collybiopsis luxurians FD-317 M1]